LAYLKLLVTFVWTAPLNLPLLPPSPMLSDLFAFPNAAASAPAPAALTTAPAEIQPGLLAVVLNLLFCLWAVGVCWRAWLIGRDGWVIRGLRRRCRAVEDRSLLQEY